MKEYGEEDIDVGGEVDLGHLTAKEDTAITREHRKRYQRVKRIYEAPLPFFVSFIEIHYNKPFLFDKAFVSTLEHDNDSVL